MNFISALKHAMIDYGIRRKAWPKEAILSLCNGHDSCQLYWLDHTKGGNRDRSRPASYWLDPVKLCGPDLTFDLTPEDLQANDWEAI